MNPGELGTIARMHQETADNGVISEATARKLVVMWRYAFLIEPGSQEALAFCAGEDYNAKAAAEEMAYHIKEEEIETLSPEELGELRALRDFFQSQTQS